MKPSTTTKKKKQGAFRLIVADTFPVVLTGLSSILPGSDFQIIATASDLATLIPAVIQNQPDGILLEKFFPDGNGYQASLLLREQGYCGIIALFTGVQDDISGAKAVASGIDGILLKTLTAVELINQLRELMTTRHSDFLSTITAKMNNSSAFPGASPLTPRESQVLRHITLGLSNKEIASSLGLGFYTVKEYVANILRKLGAADRTQAAVWAIRREQNSISDDSKNETGDRNIT